MCIMRPELAEGRLYPPQKPSLKQIRLKRKKNRAKLGRGKAVDLKRPRHISQKHKEGNIGPTKETLAKLTEDPLMRFRKRNILNDQQIWAFERIRLAIRVITRGSALRISPLNDVMVQTSRKGACQSGENCSDFEVRVIKRYCDWADQMTVKRLAIGPVLDIIIDETSLNATDRKWGRRKGWAKEHLQAALDLYGDFLRPDDRGK